MEIIIFLFTLSIIVSLFFKKSKNLSKINQYKYVKKDKIMTNNESIFFKTLKNICDESLYIIPQAHLSLFLNEKIKGQNWNGAFRKINGLSVDFLICRVDDDSIVVAIELDDKTHDKEYRVKRDKWVEDTLQEAGVKLYRTRNFRIKETDLKSELHKTLLK